MGWKAVLEYFKIGPDPPKPGSELDRIRRILFPVMTAEETPDGKKFLIDTSVDANLQTAINDLYEGHNDTATHAAIGDVLDRLTQVRRLLGAFSEFRLGEYEYVIVDTVRRDPDVRVSDIDG